MNTIKKVCSTILALILFINCNLVGIQAAEQQNQYEESSPKNRVTLIGHCRTVMAVNAKRLLYHKTDKIIFVYLHEN